MPYEERKTSEARKAQMLDAGTALARTGIKNLTRAAVARACNVSHGLVNRYFDGREGLRAEVMDHAHVKKDVEVLAQCAAMYELPHMSHELTKKVHKRIKELGHA